MNHYSKKIPLLTFLIITLFAVSSCQTERQPEIPIFSENYKRFVETLSSDGFEGRAPLTPGGRKTKAFIEAEFRRMGLEPANNGSFRQAVPLREINMSNFSDLVISDEDQSISLAYIDDMIVGSIRLQDSIKLENSELVFAGYGIVAPEYDWNDYEGLDVEGKTVVVLINDPGFELKNPDLFTGRAMTYYGRWTYKYEEAARQGAAGVLIVHETDPASYGWDVVKNSWSGPQYEVGGNNGEPTVLVQGWLQTHSAEKIFGMAGFELEELRQMALSQDFQPFSLGLNASVSFNLEYTDSDSYNIAGMVKGSVHPEETVIYMAHWDHLGMVKEPDGTKRIYNGAIDNATGTAAIMAIAEKFAKMDPPPARTVLFLAVTAEESGLIGSRYYAFNPLFPLETTAGGINIDGLNVYGPTHDVSVIGYSASTFQNILERHARDQNRRLVAESNPEFGYFYRSDHFSLVREGVPMIYANSGDDFIGRNERFAQQAREDMYRRYHSPDDVIHDMWNWKGLDQNLWLFYYVGKDLANSRYWPQWSETSEFRAIREESDQIRNNLP